MRRSPSGRIRPRVTADRLNLIGNRTERASRSVVITDVTVSQSRVVMSGRQNGASASGGLGVVSPPMPNDVLEAYRR